MRKLKASVFVLSLLSSHVLLAAPPLARPAVQNLGQKVDFKPADEGPAKPVQPAVVKIKINGLSQCTGTYVSDVGHIVLASHCMDQCKLRLTMGMDKELTDCVFEIDGKETKMKAAAMRGCSAIDFDNAVANSRAGQTSQHEKLCLDSADLAVLVPEHPPRDFKCVQINSNYSDEDSVYTLGYPMKTQRGKGDVSDPKRLHLSEGTILHSQNFCLVTSTGGQKVRKDLTKYKDYFKGRIQSDVDINAGNSGGGLFNSKGELIGVASVTQFTSSEEYCKGDTTFEPIKNLPALLTQSGIEAAKCAAHSISYPTGAQDAEPAATAK